ncbi:ABC transporter permease [Pueribacillus theae]|uniref:ABC transporter permease n=1 Tax=Pueribacillus theae TaxID=2171751 RepID=A0A2U1JJ20_9BACI|nr:ABC transporter permease [Pueribacillus theae]
MKNVWISEFERMFKRKKTWVGLFVYLFLLGFECLFLYGVGGQSFYDPDHVVGLNSLNTAPFFLRELGLFLIFVLIPMFVVDSFNGEYTSGAYRLVLLRPQGRAKLFAIKWSVQGVLIFGLLVFTWLAATIYGYLVFPNVTEVSFFNTGELQSSEAFLYVLTFYAIALLILLAILTIGSLISTVMPNVILSYIGIIGFLIGGLYVSDHFSFFITFTDSIFQVLGKQNMTLIPLAFSIVLISAILNVTIWTKRDWME